ncbi:MAG: putative lipid II flippase FtsW [Pseudomonadota bacterium]|nr:MAG: putative lipid II flippase FtsW [Pseudomonadota bacterium]
MLSAALKHRTGPATSWWPVTSFGVDPWLAGCAAALLALGLVMVGSASMSVAERELGQPFYYVMRQGLFAGAGLLLGAGVLMVPLRVWERAGPLLVALAALLLLVIFVPGLGREVNGSLRWIALGPVNLQPSEVAKLFTIIYLAGYLVRHRDAVRSSAAGFLRPMVLLLLLVVLMLLEPDFGAAAVLLATAMGMMWLGGVRLLQFSLLLVLVAGALALLAWLEPYRLERLTIFLNPWKDPFDSGFQLTQALIAFGRGEWFGVGLGESVQKLFYLPEAHTDFVFAVLAEELGLLGAAVVIVLFAALVWRALRIGHCAQLSERPFAGYLAWGLGLWIGLQAFINIGVNTGVLPTKGLTLPLMSYGGSSLVVNCVALALLMRVDYETRKEDRMTQRKGRRRS